LWRGQSSAAPPSGTQNEALFNVSGPTYSSGGPGTFDLPDLDGRSIIGAEGTTILPGFEEGVGQHILTADNIPTTSSNVPKPRRH
jgi:microcystin-dependent protein